MDQHNLNTELERAYYLPPSGSGLEKVWASKSDSQVIYADLCQRGHTIIANQILEGIKNGNPPSIKDLYRTAARVRRSLAVLNQPEDKKTHFYGQPNVSSFEDGFHDTLHVMPGSRYEGFLEQARVKFESVYELIRSGRFKEEFGMSFDVSRTQERRYRQFSITHPDLESALSKVKILRGVDGPVILLHHAFLKDHPTIFGWADKNLQEILEGNISSQEHWKNIAQISLHLFHMAPLRLGSQTASLMVLAGISKAMGYEVLPRKLGTDHFIEAELTPYHTYIRQYEGQFISPPKLIKHSGVLPVDDSFVNKANSIIAKRYVDEMDPCLRITKYINECWDIPEGIKITVTSLEVEDSHMKINVVPKSQQKLIDYGCDFVGGKDMINMLDLPQGKFEHEPKSIKPIRRGYLRGR